MSWRAMTQTILTIMNTYGYGAIFALILIENIFPPIPSEVILSFGGFMTTYTSMHVAIVILVASLGSLVGAYALYAIGYLLSEKRLMRLFSSTAMRRLGFIPQDVHIAINSFNKHGKATVFFCRFIPIVRSLISVPAGTARMNILSFTVLTFAGSMLWNTVLVLLGRGFGSAWEEVVAVFDSYSTIAAILIALALVIAGGWLYLKVLKPRITAAREAVDQQSSAS